jgi:hypothetical protein
MGLGGRWSHHVYEEQLGSKNPTMNMSRAEGQWTKTGSSSRIMSAHAIIDFSAAHIMFCPVTGHGPEKKEFVL